jgi:hypothetical protein
MDQLKFKFLVYKKKRWCRLHLFFLYFYLLILRIMDDPRVLLAVASLIAIESRLLTLSMMSGNAIRPEAQPDDMLLRTPVAV